MFLVRDREADRDVADRSSLPKTPTPDTQIWGGGGLSEGLRV